MKIEVNIGKKHLLVFAGILTIALFGFVYAQTAPNPGHAFNQLSGVQAAISNGMTACSGSNLAIKTINPTTGAVTCETDDVGSGSGGTGAVTGSVVGGGAAKQSGFAGTCRELWGVATCNSATFGSGSIVCPAGTTTKRTAGVYDYVDTTPYYMYYCIQN